MPHYRYPHNCYLMLKKLDDNGRITWATKVKQFLFKYGFRHVWISQDFGDEHLSLSVFKQRVKDCTIQNWHADLDDSTRCDTYKYFKSLLVPEMYLKLELSFKLMKSLPRFRCSGHKLNTEIGRHHNIDKDDQICLHCFMTEDTDG